MVPGSWRELSGPERVSGKGQSVRGSRYLPVHGGGALGIGQCRFIHQRPPGPDRQPNGSAGEQPRTGTVFSHLSGTDGCTGGQQGLAVACAGSGQASLATSLTLHESREGQDGICVLEQPRRGEAKREGPRPCILPGPATVLPAPPTRMPADQEQGTWAVAPRRYAITH